MSIQIINPAEIYDGSPFGMSQAAFVEGGDDGRGLLFISGQVDWNRDYKVKHSDIEAQTKGALGNLATVLESANSSIAKLLHLRVYVRGELADHMEKVVPVLKHFLGSHRPALTGIGVASLASPDTLIEIEAVARL